VTLTDPIEIARKVRNFRLVRVLSGHRLPSKRVEDGTVQTTRRRPAAARLAPERVHEFVPELLGDDVHAARVLSFASGVVGVLHAWALGVHAIGRGLADAMGLDPKHAPKQVDRPLSNTGITVWAWFDRWGSFVVAARSQRLSSPRMAAPRLSSGRRFASRS